MKKKYEYGGDGNGPMYCCIYFDCRLFLNVEFKLYCRNTMMDNSVEELILNNVLNLRTSSIKAIMTRELYLTLKLLSK